MRITRDSKVCIQPGWYILISAMLLLLPLKLVAGWLIAAVIHESAHLICIKILGVKIQGISVGVAGTMIQTGMMDIKAELISAIAGPFGSLLLLFVRRQFPLLALCGLIQAMFNVLPLYPLDGGRVFCCAASLLRCPVFVRLFVEWSFLVGWLIAGILAWFVGIGPVPVFCAIMLLIKNGKIKSPCKESKQIVQYKNKQM